MLHITMSNTVKVFLSCIALGFRKEKNTGVLLGSIYLSIHLCLCLRHSKALQLLSSGQWGGWKVLQLACSPTAGQYFYRLCDCSARTQICLHFPCHPLPQSWRLHWLSFCHVSHNLQSICNQPLGKLFTKEPLFFRSHTWHPDCSISCLFLCTSNHCFSSVCNHVGGRQTSR